MKKLLFYAGVTALFSCFSSGLAAHGLIESPPSRNYFCGAITKPAEALAGTGQYSQCSDVFDQNNKDQGYSFMSVLTHTRGRLRPLPPLTPTETPPGNEQNGVPPLADNVCGYDAETFGNGPPTPWDKPINWPTNSVSPGELKITWDISWGPHFSDTQEFHYWITKPGFNYQVGQPLEWSDFEEQPFCQLDFDFEDPNANPNVVARVDDAKFDTFCNLPQRSGRHVIYGEWGRNYYTWERFHGCVDVVFDGGEVIDADIDVIPAGDLSGSGSVVLSGEDSSGSGLSYAWKIESQSTNANYQFTNPNKQITELSFTDPNAGGSVVISLTVSKGDLSNTATVELSHFSAANPSNWKFQKPLTEGQSLNIGDKLQLRVVLNNGQDLYFPEDSVVLSSGETSAAQWPLVFGQAVNNASNIAKVGVLNANDRVRPWANATTNNIYTKVGENIAGVFLQIESAPAKAKCTYIVESQWAGGFSGKIVIENTTPKQINGWSVSWSYEDGSTISHLWNARLSGSYTATNVNWNAAIAPGDSLEFGFVGRPGSGPSSTPAVTGEICQ